MTAAETGQAGERAVAQWLRREGYELRHLNWRRGRYELDIVAYRRAELHFVEVKSRRAGGLTPPEAAMTLRKQRALLHAASAYLAQYPWDGECFFDLAAVDCFPDGSLQIRFHSDVIQCHW